MTTSKRDRVFFFSGREFLKTRPRFFSRARSIRNRFLFCIRFFIIAFVCGVRTRLLSKALWPRFVETILCSCLFEHAGHDLADVGRELGTIANSSCLFPMQYAKWVGCGKRGARTRGRDLADVKRELGTLTNCSCLFPDAGRELGPIWKT